MATTCTGTNIFTTNAGKIIALDGNSVPITFSVDGSADTFHDLKAIVTSVGIQARAGYQFMHALREYIYLYVFTERIGEIVINGIAFPDVCNDLGAQSVAGDGQSGLQKILTWYEAKRITSNFNAINISFGGLVTYQAFLVACNATVVNTGALAGTDAAQFAMRFNYVPNISDSDDFCFDNKVDEDLNSCEPFEHPCESL